MVATHPPVMQLETKHIEALDQAEGLVLQRDVTGYLKLKALLQDSRPEAHAKFRSLFTNYYGLNTGGLTDEFKDRYFEILFGGSVMLNAQPDFSGILMVLSGIKRRTNTYAMPFSFVSKLVGIHYEDSPIYDKHVLAFFGEKPSTAATEKSVRISRFIKFLDRVSRSYASWADDSRVQPIVERFRSRDPGLASCHVVRLMDFLVWKVGNKKLLTQ